MNPVENLSQMPMDKNIKDFYGYLLISQVETVEAVNSLERQVCHL
jgi:hypothetical protein